jgi:hypothetical protein
MTRAETGDGRSVVVGGSRERCAAFSSALAKFLKAAADGGERQGLSAHELLCVAREAFEPLFHEPPIGPVPDYLSPHGSLHGCVAEYEEKLEELDRWKALQLHHWLKGRVGATWCVAGKVYQLQAEKQEGAATERFSFRCVGRCA